MDITANVLVVDDDEINIFILKRLLGRISPNIKVSASFNGKQAIEQLVAIQNHDPANLPAFIFLDLTMPIMDGWEFLNEYERLNLSSLPNIIILTSSIFDHDINKASTYHLVKGFMSKPMQIDELKELLKLGAMAY